MLKKSLLLCALALISFMAGAEEILPIYFKQDPGVVIDGNLTKEDWSDIGSLLHLDSARGNRKTANALYQWKQDADADLSAEVKLAYRMDGFSIGCRIRDDVHHQNRTGADCWRGDHVELLLDFKPLSDPERVKFGEGQYHIILSPGSLDGRIGPEAYMMSPEKQPLKLAVAAVRTENGYQLEAEIPWSVFGYSGQQYPQRQLIGVDVMISDTDGEADVQEKYLFAGPQPFGLKRNRLLKAYLSDPRGSIPANLQVSGKQVLCQGPVRMDEKSNKFRIGFDYQPESGLTPVLRFKAFGHSGGKLFAGYSRMLKVLVNGELLKGGRLFNKNNKAALQNGKPFLFVNALGEIALPYIRSGDNHPGEKNKWYVFRDDQDWLNFEFELGGLLKPGKNVIVFDNEDKKTARFSDVEISDVIFFQSSKKSRNKRPAPTGEIPVITPAPVGKVPFEWKELSDSSLEITLNGETYRLDSRWSVPEGRFVTGENPYFTRKREVIRKDELLVVKDTLTNRTGNDLPVMHFHEITASPEAEFFLNGFAVSKTMRIFQENADNNSTYVKNAKSGLGLFPLDDIFRVHGDNYVASDTAAGIADRTLVIPAGTSLSYELAVIPTEQADYYAFVNALRRELDVNFQVNGSLCFPSDWWPAKEYWLNVKDRKKVVEALRRYVTGTDSRYAWIYGSFLGAHCSSGRYGSQKGHPSRYIEENRKTYLQLLSLIREAAPDVHTMVYYHCYIDSWPESMTQFKDDATINAYGQHQHYYAMPPGPKVSMLYVPTLTNGFGKACEKQIDEILQYHCPPNAAFYWDEFKYAKVPYTWNPNIWDGCSGEIDGKTFQLKRRKTSISLASAGFRLAMVRKIKASGREIVVNTMPWIRSIMKEKVMAFTETAQIGNCARGHTYTPIQLGNHLIGRDAEKPEVIYHQMLEGLDFGMLYYYYHIRYIPDHPTLTQHMFPVTPMELHKGYIIGKEKIITRVSGLYGWNDASGMTAFVYDDKGWPVPDFQAPVVQKDGKNFLELRLPEDWSAVILRKQEGAK